MRISRFRVPKPKKTHQKYIVMTTFANQHSQNNIRDRLVSIPDSDRDLP